MFLRPVASVVVLDPYLRRKGSNITCGSVNACCVILISCAILDLLLETEASIGDCTALDVCVVSSEYVLAFEDHLVVGLGA